MKQNISCAIIRDLIPTYLDELTSEETKQMMEAHFAECRECRTILEELREPKRDEKEVYCEEKELDFLKKNKKKSKFIFSTAVIISIAGILAGIIFPFFTKHELSYGEVNTDVTVGDIQIENTNVNDGMVSLTARSSGTYGIRRVDFSEKDGVVSVKIIGARDKIWTSPVYETKYHTTHTIKKIEMDGNTIWENGMTISDETLAVYHTAHPYVGNHVKNGETLSALKVSDLFGAYTMQLQTSQEPYGMTIILEKPIEKQKEAYLKNYMGFAAYNCMAVIDNLSDVTVQYETEEGRQEITWNLETAQQLLGHSVKEYRKSKSLLELLKWDYYGKLG